MPDPVELARFLEALRLFHPDLLLKFAMEEGSLDVQLFHLPVKEGCNVQGQALGFEVGNQGVHFHVIKAPHLCEATYNKANFVPNRVAKDIIFDSEEETAANNMAARRDGSARTQGVHTMLADRVELVFIGSSPIGSMR